MDYKEVAIDYLIGEDYCTATVDGTKYINQVYKLKEKHPTLVDIVYTNPDGSMVVHFPSDWFRFPAPPKSSGRKFTEEEKKANGDRLREYHRKKKEGLLDE